MEEASQGGRIGPGLVMVNTHFGEPDLAGILEAALVAAAGLAIFSIGIDGGDGAGLVGDADHRAALIGQQPAPDTGTAFVGGSKKYMLRNWQGSVIALADGSGNVAAGDIYKYGPFGESNNPASGSLFRYTGQVYDAETGLYHYKARAYSASLGRFLQTDPAGTEDDQNLYGYVGNDPLNNTDPTGAIVETGWDLANVALGAASLSANIATGNVAGAVIDAAGLVVDIAATAVPGVPGGAGAAIKAARGLEKAADVARSPVARGRMNEALKLAEINAQKNTRKASTSFGDRIRDGTLPDGNHVEVKDTKRLDLTQQLRGLDEAAGKEGGNLNIYTGKGTEISRNINYATLPSTRIYKYGKLDSTCIQWII